MNNYYTTPNMSIPPQNQGIVTQLPIEQSYIENILRMNKGKFVKVFQTFPDASIDKDKVFEGIIEESGRDHIILNDTKTGKWYLLYMIYVDYIEFNEEINYIPQFGTM